MQVPDIVAWAGSVSLVLVGWIITARAVLHTGARVSTLGERVAHLEGKLSVPLELPVDKTKDEDEDEA